MPSAEVESLRVVGAAVLEAGRLLLVSKHAAADVFYLPGGKPEDGEAPLDCLRPGAEIARLVWASSPDAVPGRVAPVVRDQLFPLLAVA